ncbi:MAG: hypothetical protein HQL97_09135 [Magnetococcales bacterium]|nr:hypothetical protein [Magnetococcales bacterium]
MSKPWGNFYGHAARECDDCGRAFYPRQGWERICYPCWRAGKNAEEQELSEQAGALQKKAQELRTLEGELEQWGKELIEWEHRLKLREQHAANEWPGMLMRLIKLAHPDRHDNSREANDVTRWLIDQRERLHPG